VSPNCPPPNFASFSRKITYLRLSITDLCNFNCFYCRPKGFKLKDPISSPLNPSEIFNLSSAFSEIGVQKVRLSGGEPCLRGDLPEIINKIKSIDGIKKIALTTNGFKLYKNARVLKEEGLTAVNISLDSLDKNIFKKFTGSKHFEKIIVGIHKALEQNLEVKINVVLIKGTTEREIFNWLDFIKSVPITIRFIELMPTKGSETILKNLYLKNDIFLRYFKENGWVQKISQVDSGPAREYSHPDYAGSMGLISPYAKDFCISCNRLRVLADGNLVLCLYNRGKVPLRHLVQCPSTKDKLIRVLKESLKSKPSKNFLSDKTWNFVPEISKMGG